MIKSKKKMELMYAESINEFKYKEMVGIVSSKERKARFEKMGHLLQRKEFFPKLDVGEC